MGYFMTMIIQKYVSACAHARVCSYLKVSISRILKTD